MDPRIRLGYELLAVEQSLTGEESKALFFALPRRLCLSQRRVLDGSVLIVVNRKGDERE